MHDINVIQYQSMDSIEAGEWDSIVDDEEIYNTHAYLWAIEHSGVNDLCYYYLTFYQHAKLIAHASVSVFIFGLDIMIKGAAGEYVDRIKRTFPRFLQIKLIECGHPTTLGSSIVFADVSPETAAQVLLTLDTELAQVAKKEKTSLIAVRDVYSSRLSEYSSLRQSGYGVVPNMANTLLRIYQASFQEYLDDLVAKRRREIVHRMHVFEEQGCVVEKIHDFADIADVLEELWRMTYVRAKEYQREVLNAAYFRNLSDALGDKSFVLLCKKAGRPIGFTMLIESGVTLISTYCGLDYTYNRSTYSYFVLFYRSIREAIELRMAWLELGVTNYNPKIEIGAVPEPMYIYARSTRRLLNSVLIPILKAADAPPDYNKRRVFNNRYYERHPIHDNIEVDVGGQIHRLTDLSVEGMGTTCSEKPRRKKAAIRVGISDGLFILLSGRLRASERIEGGVWHAGYAVEPMSPDHRPLWYELVGRYAADATN